MCLRHVPDPPCPRFTYLPGFLAYALKWPADGGTASRVTAPNSSGVRLELRIGPAWGSHDVFVLLGHAMSALCDAVNVHADCIV